MDGWMEGLKNFVGKKVYVVLKTGRKYSGVIKEFTDSFLFLKDKFGEKVVIAISEISILEEER